MSLQIIMNSLEGFNFSCQDFPIYTEGLAQVQKLLKTHCTMPDGFPYVDYVLAHPGKQLRPLLCFAISDAKASDIMSDIYHIAAAIEGLHLASIQHDDVIDHSDTRRGVPTTRKKWDNKTAILTGDYLLSQAFKLILTVKNTNILETFHTMAHHLVMGQIKEHKFRHTWFDHPLQHYIEMIEGKTAALFQGAVHCVALRQGHSPKILDALQHYSTTLGRVFQLMDDYLDYYATQTGKPQGADYFQGNITFPPLHIYQTYTTYRPLLRECFSHICPENFKKMTDLCHREEIQDSLKKSIQAHADTALQALNHLPALWHTPLSHIMHWAMHRLF